MRCLGLVLCALAAVSCGGKVDTVATPAGNDDRSGMVTPPPPSDVPPAPPISPPIPTTLPSEAALDQRCAWLESISSAFRAQTASELESYLEGTWYACGGTTAMGQLFRSAAAHPTNLDKMRGFVLKGNQGWPLDVWGGDLHPVFCLECSFPVSYLDGTRVDLGVVFDATFIGGKGYGMRVSRADAPGTSAYFVHADY